MSELNSDSRTLPSRMTEPLTIVGLGEVLFDVFEDGTETLGGAPLNVAVHAHQLLATLSYGAGVVASRVGADLHGRHILDLLTRRGMSTQYVQTDSEHPTGVVSVSLQHGEPGYQIERGAAWDFVAPKPLLDELAGRCQAVCFGSLAQRSPVSRQTIQRFLQKAPNALRLYDVNLRRNTLTHEAGYSAEVIEETCHLTTIIKLNLLELAELCDLYGIDVSGASGEKGVQQRIERMLKRFPVEAVVLTRGPDGTTLFTRDDEFAGNCRPMPLTNVHPVGAGDACSAGLLFGLVLGWHPNEAIDLANQMGTWVASQLSATPLLPDSILSFVRQRVYAHSVA